MPTVFSKYEEFKVKNFEINPKEIFEWLANKSNLKSSEKNLIKYKYVKLGAKILVIHYYS